MYFSRLCGAPTANLPNRNLANLNLVTRDLTTENFFGEDLAVAVEDLAVEGEENQLSDSGPRRNFTTNLRLANLDANLDPVNVNAINVKQANLYLANLYLANFRPVEGFLADPTSEYLLEPTLAVGSFIGSLISELNNSLVDPTAPAAPNNSPDGHASFRFCVKTEERRYSLTTPLGWFRNSSLKQKPFCAKKLLTCFRPPS